MSLLIVTSRYLKSGTAKTKSQRKNYTKYIATRESVEVREQSKKYWLFCKCWGRRKRRSFGKNQMRTAF